MIVWLEGESGLVRDVARIAASALVQRGFAVEQAEPDSGDEPAASLLARARDLAARTALVLALAGPTDAGESDSPSSPQDDVIRHRLGDADAADPGRAAETLLDTLEQRGVLQWGYSREEEAQIQKHLEDLGYL